MRQRMNVDTQKKCKDAGQTMCKFGFWHWSFSEKLYLEKSREYLFQKRHPLFPENDLSYVAKPGRNQLF